MTLPEAPSRTGTRPVYLSPEEAAEFAGLPIGARILSVAEEADMLAAGLTPEKIADMTPEALKQLGDITLKTSELFLGS